MLNQRLIFRFIVEHTVAISLEVGVGYLLAKLFAHTLRIGVSLSTARAIPAVFFHRFLQTFNDFVVLVEFYHTFLFLFGEEIGDIANAVRGE